MKAGWGDWAGPGASTSMDGASDKITKKRNRLLTKIHEEEADKKKGRADNTKKMFNVMIAEKRVKSASKFKIADVPHPFTSREEYERSLRMPLGGTFLL